MNKRFKVLALSAIIALAITLPLAAQNHPDGGVTYISDPSGTVLQGVADPTSNQRNATASLYKTDVDNYLNVNNWSAVNLEKWFAFLHGSGTTLPGFRGNLGYATKVGGLYIAARYWGNIFQQRGDGESITLTPTYDTNTHALTSVEEVTTYADRWRNSNNHLDILIGIAGQGIRLGFFEAMAFNSKEGNRLFTKTDYQNGLISYEGETDEFSQFGGNLRPSFQWGTLLNISNLTIKPRLGAAINIYMDKLFDSYYANYTTFNGNPTDVTKTLNRAAGYNNGYMRPIFTVGADIGLPKKDTVATTITIDYLMGLNTYKNDYKASGFDGTAKGPVSWAAGTTATTTSVASQTTNTTTTLTFNDSKNMSHRIVPKITLDKAIMDGLKLGLVIQAPITITTTKSDQYSEEKTFNQVTNFNPINSAAARTTTETIVHTPSGLTETTAFTVTPQIRVGTSYALVPGRFTVNAGVQLDPTAFTNTKTTISSNGDGARTTQTITNGDGIVIGKTDTTTLTPFSDSSTVRSNWDSFVGAVGGGFLFSFNENIVLDLWANSGNFGPGSGWTVDAASVNVMLSLKF